MSTFAEYNQCNLQAFEVWKAQKIQSRAKDETSTKAPTETELLTLAANEGAIARQWATLEISRRTLDK